MDLEDWEVVPEDGSLETLDDGGKKYITREYNVGISNIDFDMNYFAVNSSQEFQDLADQTGKLLTRTVKNVETETVSQENQFADMKIEYPSFSDRGIYPVIGDDVLKLMSECEAEKGEITDGKTDSDKEIENERGVFWEEKSEVINIWKRSLSGVGAICSFGVAVATFCVVILGHKQMHRHDQKIRFQICADEKRIKHVVHNAVKLDEAFSSARHVLSRAHITVGGHCHGL